MKLTEEENSIVSKIVAEKISFYRQVSESKPNQAITEYTIDSANEKLELLRSIQSKLEN